MGTLLERFQDDLTAARKAQDKPRLLAIGTVLSEIRNRELELRRAVNDDDVVEVVRRAIKRRRESIQMYGDGGRADLAEKEEYEAALLEGYLPAQVDPEEIRAAVRAAVSAGAANVGAVMGKVMPAFRGRADGALINRIVREELAPKG